MRASTVPMSIDVFCRGFLKELEAEGYDVTVVSSPGEAMARIAEREGVKTVEVEMERRIAPLKDLRSLWNLYKAFRRIRPRLVHTITPKAGLLGMMAAKLAGVPVRLHTFTGLVFPTATGLVQKILVMTDRMTCACATHVNPEGEGVKNDLVNYGITRKPLRVLGHGNVRGIDLEYFDPEREDVKSAAAEIAADGMTTILFVGRVAGDKGVNELVEAFERVHSRHADTRLVVVGPDEQSIDPLKPWVAKRIAEGEGILTTGRQTDVRPWMAAADMLVLPSYREGFPNVVIEAGAMGLPSVVTNINGAREIIIEGENGLIVEAHDADGLERAIERLIEDAALRKRLAGKARKMVADRYEQGYVRRCLKDYYKEILGEI